MQTALCYLEAIRAKVPQILRDENSGIRPYFMPESAIHPATEAEFQMDRKLSNLDESELSTKLTKTERLTDEDADCETSTGVPLEGVLIPLPSPLLCPRRPRRPFLADLYSPRNFLRPTAPGRNYPDCHLEKLEVANAPPRWVRRPRCQLILLPVLLSRLRLPVPLALLHEPRVRVVSIPPPRLESRFYALRNRNGLIHKHAQAPKLRPWAFGLAKGSIGALHFPQSPVLVRGYLRHIQTLLLRIVGISVISRALTISSAEQLATFV